MDVRNLQTQVNNLNARLNPMATTQLPGTRPNSPTGQLVTTAPGGNLDGSPVNGNGVTLRNSAVYYDGNMNQYQNQYHRARNSWNV